jgi:hypothetical protein
MLCTQTCIYACMFTLPLSIFLSFFPNLPHPSLSPSHAHTHTTPAVGWYLPAPQSSQWEEPSVAWNLPAGHEVHAAASEEVDPTAPYLPAAHNEPAQVVGAVAPTIAEYLPALQSMQTEEPVCDDMTCV